MEYVAKNAKIEKIKAHIKKNQAAYFTVGVIATASIAYFIGQKRKPEFVPSDVLVLRQKDGNVLMNFWDRENRLPEHAFEDIEKFVRKFPNDAKDMDHIVHFVPRKQTKGKFDYVLAYATPID